MDLRSMQKAERRARIPAAARDMIAEREVEMRADAAQERISTGRPAAGREVARPAAIHLLPEKSAVRHEGHRA